MLINKDWKITSGEMNVNLYRRSVNKKTGSDKWTAEGYFATLEGAVDFMVDKEVKGTGLTDVRIVIEKINELKRSIKELVR